MDFYALLILALLGAMVMMLPLIVFFSLSLLAITIFVWRKLFPFGWGIAEWITNRRNLIPFVLFMLVVLGVTVMLLILSFLLALNVHWIGWFLVLLLLPVLGIAYLIFSGGMGLAIILWIIRLSHGGFALFRRGFWRMFPPGGPPTLQPVPPLPANPLSVLAPPARPARRRRQRLPAGQRIKGPSPLVPPSEEKAQSKAKAEAEKAKAKPEAKAKAKAEEEVKQAKRQAIAEAKAKAQARAEAKQAKRQAIAEAKAKAKAEEEVKQAKRQAIAEAKQVKAQAEEEAKTEEITKPRRRRRLKRRK